MHSISLDEIWTARVLTYTTYALSSLFESVWMSYSRGQHSWGHRMTSYHPAPWHASAWGFSAWMSLLGHQMLQCLASTVTASAASPCLLLPSIIQVYLQVVSWIFIYALHHLKTFTLYFDRLFLMMLHFSQPLFLFNGISPPSPSISSN